MNKLFYFTAGAGSAVLIIWMFVVTPIIINNDDFFEITAQNIGEVRFAEIGEELSDPRKMVFDWQRNVLEKNGNEALIRTSYDYKDIITEESFWKFQMDEKIDIFSRGYIKKAGFFMFPIHLEKKDYQVYDVGGEVLSYKFEGEEKINGLNVYKFAGQTTFDVSEMHPDLSQTVYEDYSAVNYIEPETGLEISFVEKFSDYILVEGEKVYVLSAWSKSTPFSENILTKKANQLITFHEIYEVFIPILMIVFIINSCLAIVVHSFYKKKHLSLQEEIQKAEKFASFGQLSAQLAHNIRNPLNVIKLTNELLLKHADVSEKDKERLNRIATATKRISNQVDEMMNFVRNPKAKKQNQQLDKIIQQVISDIVVPEGIKIVNKTNENYLFANEEEIYSLFHNLIQNAIEAIGETKGTISISQQVQKGNIEIKIEDSGPGIKKADISRIFDPLFTTKQNGTGLGLVSCKKIVENHGGKITFSNNPSTFTIALPLQTQKISNSVAQ